MICSNCDFLDEPISGPRSYCCPSCATMDAVLKCIHNMNPCYEALDDYLRFNDINDRSPKGLTLLATAIHVFLSFSGSTLKNIDALLQRGADPHLDGSFAIAGSFSNNFGLFKLIIDAPKFNPKYLDIKCTNFEMNGYIMHLSNLYYEALYGGLPYLLRTNFSWPIPGMLLKTLGPSERRDLLRMAAENKWAPHNIRQIFFNKTSSAHRLPTAVAQYICKFFIRPTTERANVRDFVRLLK